MASGLPVIVSCSAGVSEILTPDRDCLVWEDANEIDLLAQHLARLVSDERLRTSLGAEARKTAERHSWDQVVERTLAVYGETLGGSR